MQALGEDQVINSIGVHIWWRKLIPKAVKKIGKTRRVYDWSADLGGQNRKVMQRQAWELHADHERATAKEEWSSTEGEQSDYSSADDYTPIQLV